MEVWTYFIFMKYNTIMWEEKREHSIIMAECIMIKLCKAIDFFI